MNIPIVFAFSNKYFLPGWISIASLIKTAKQDTKYLIHILLLHCICVDSRLCGKSSYSMTDRQRMLCDCAH